MIKEDIVKDTSLITTQVSSLSGNVTIAAGESVDMTFDVSKNGYTPIGIVGWYFDPYYANISRITSITDTTITLRLANWRDASINVSNRSIRVLYVKK